MSNKNYNTEVFCTLQIEGIHAWPGCPFDEVAYLRDPHRHLFHIKAWKKVTHSDRDVEFIMLKHMIEHYFLTHYRQTVVGPTNHGNVTIIKQEVCVFGSKSCEMIAQELIEHFDLSRCEVSEDNENGAIVEVEDVTP